MSSHDINLWYEDIANAIAKYPEQWAMLDQSEKAHADSLKNDLNRNRFVAVRARLRELLGIVVNNDPQHLHIKRAKHGKPYLSDYPEVAFNLSHTADKLAVITGYSCQLGVDIELCKPRANITALVERCFAEEEQAYWHQLPTQLQTQEFYRFWTRKEAFVKGTGRGIALGLKECVINPHNPGELLRLPVNCGRVSDWRIQDLEVDPPFCGALAVSGGIDRPVGVNLINRSRA